MQGQGIVTVTSLRNPRRELAKELEARRQLEGRDKQENMEREARQEGGVFTLVFTEISCATAFGLRSTVTRSHVIQNSLDTPVARFQATITFAGMTSNLENGHE